MSNANFSGATSSSIGQAYHVELADSLIDPDRPTKDIAQFIERSETDYAYRVFLYLKGRHVYMVHHVEYQLPPNLSEKPVTVVRTSANSACKLPLEIRSVFPVRAMVFFKTGDRVELEYLLRFNEEIERNQGLKFQRSLK